MSPRVVLALLALGTLFGGGPALGGEVVFVPGEFPETCPARLRGEQQLSIQVDSCSTAPRFADPEYRTLQVARAELAGMIPRFDGTIFLLDDRDMGIEMRVRFDNVVYPGARRATVLAGPTWIGRDPVLVIGMAQAQGQNDDAWREIVRNAARSAMPPLEPSAAPVCRASDFEGDDAEEFRRLGVIANTIRDVGIGFAERRRFAVADLVNHIGAEEVRAAEEFRLGRAVFRSMGIQVLGLAAENGSKLMPGGGGVSAGGGALMAAKAAFNVIVATVGEYDRVEEQNRQVAADAARANAMTSLGEQALRWREAVWTTGRTELYLQSRYCVMTGGERRAFVEALETVFPAGGDLARIIDRYYGTLDQVKLASFVGYIRLAGEGGRPGHIKAVYEYDEDESNRSYTFRRKRASIEVARGGDAIEAKLNVLMESLRIGDVFRLDVERYVCTTGDWNELGQNEQGTECGSVTPSVCSRPRQGGQSRREGCENVDWDSSSGPVRRASIRLPSSPAHYQAQEYLNRSNPRWMEEWTRFDRY